MPKVVVNKVRTFTGHKDAVYTLNPSTDPRFFFSSGGDGLVVRWNLAGGDDGDLIAQVPNSVYSLCLIPDKNYLVIGNNYQGIHLIDLEKKSEIVKLPFTQSAIFDIKYYNHCLYAATGDGVLTQISDEPLKIIKQVCFSKKSARAIHINPDRNEVAIGYSDHFIRIFDLDTLEMKFNWEAHKNSVFSVFYTRNGLFLLSGGRDAHLKVWDVKADYKAVSSVPAHLFAIHHIFFSPDNNHFATCSLDKTIKIWEAQDVQLLKVIDKARHGGHTTSVNKLLWTDYNNSLISCSDDRTISSWDINFNKE